MCPRGDCDDNNASVNPAATESTCNGLDDDCSSSTVDDPDNDGDGFVERFAIHNEDSDVQSEHGFSRSLVQAAIDTREMLHVRYPRIDPRFASKKSVQAMRVCSVLVAPSATPTRSTAVR